MIKKYRLSFIISLILIIAVYSFLFYQLFFKTDIKQAFETISHLRFFYFLVGIGLTAVLMASQSLFIVEIFKLYQVKLSFKEGVITWLMTVPTGAVTAGLGGVAVLFYKARRKGCSRQFSAVITISYFIFNFSAILIFSLLFGGSAFVEAAIRDNYSIVVSFFFIFSAVLFCFLLFNRKMREVIFRYVRRFFPKFLLREEMDKINELKNSQIADIFLYVFFIFLANFIIFAFSLFVFRANLGFISLLKNFSMVQVISVISPSGGGLGFVELGMLGSLRFSGISLHEAGAITIVYRLFNFWLPAVLGWGIFSLKGMDYIKEIKNSK